jgi:hypothetical protein
MKKPSEEKLFEVFNKIIASEELAERAINSPSEVFMELGLEIDSPVFIDENFYEFLPELKKHFEDAAAGNPHPDALDKCDSPKCLACLSGMGIAVGALISAAVAAFPLADEIIAEIAELCGCDAEFIEELIKQVVKGELSVSGVLKKICQKLGTC